MIGDLIGEWIKGILIDGIMGNLSGLFNTVNTKVGEIASDVGSTPQDWNGGKTCPKRLSSPLRRPFSPS